MSATYSPGARGVGGAIEGATLLVEVDRQGGVECEDSRPLVAAILALASCRLRDLGRAARGSLEVEKFWAPHKEAWTPRTQARKTSSSTSRPRPEPKERGSSARRARTDARAVLRIGAGGREERGDRLVEAPPPLSGAIPALVPTCQSLSGHAAQCQRPTLREGPRCVSVAPVATGHARQAGTDRRPVVPSCHEGSQP